MFEFVDVVLQRRRSIIIGTTVVVGLLFICVLAPIVQSRDGGMTARLQTSYASQASLTAYDSSNVVANALGSMMQHAGQAADTARVRLLGGVMTLASSVTHFDRDIGHGAHAAGAFTLDGVIMCATFTAHTVNSALDITVHIVSSVALLTTHIIGTVFTFTSRSIDAPSGSTGRVNNGMFKDSFGLLHGLVHPSSIIRAQDGAVTPVITALRARQAAIIQSGTTDVQVSSEVTSVSNGTGGACDNGNGNGGYPMVWCNAAMDSESTIPVSSDPINRECTSYAYWYFASIEGHTDLRVSGNAKYWAATSNYPTHTAPAIGAIAVETKGTYGHVAIVQALPGQEYSGRSVPAGYVLVSEMNYDWHGHFRYSYSPLSKFSAYIYP